MLKSQKHQDNLDRKLASKWIKMCIIKVGTKTFGKEMKIMCKKYKFSLFNNKMENDEQPQIAKNKLWCKHN